MYIIVGLCAGQILPAVNYVFPQKNSIKSFCSCALCGTYPYLVSVSDSTDFFKNRHDSIKLCLNKSNKIPRLNKPSCWDTNSGMSATVVSRHCSCTRKTIERLRRRFRVTGNVADRPRSGGPRVTTAADDRCIILQHLRNRRLTAAATGRQYGIHPQHVRNRLRQNVQPIRAYRPYFGKILS